MAYDEPLADRIRLALADRPNLTERKMFGGIAFMLSGNMAAGVSGDDLIVRLDPEEGSGPSTSRARGCSTSPAAR